MTHFIATTRMTLTRGTTTNALDDVVDSAAPLYLHLPAAVVEDQQQSFIASQLRGGVVEMYTIRLRPDADVQEGDRLQDETRTELIYQVQSVSNPPGVVGMADLRVTAVRTGAHSQTVNA